MIELVGKEYNLGTIYLDRDILKGEEIDIEAHFDARPRTFLSDKNVVGHEYQEKLKSSLALTLREETGLAIRSMGQGTTQPVLRGYAGDRFLLTDDGVTTGDLSTTSIDHTISLDMASFQKIKVIRGPESLLYGSNTIGGVINVSRQNNIESRFNTPRIFTLTGYESANKSLFGNVVFFLPYKQNQFRFSTLNRSTGNQITPKGIIDNSALSNFETTGSYTYFGKVSRSTAILEYISMNYGIPGSYEGHINGVDIRMEKFTQKFNYHRDISALGFQYFDVDQRIISYNHTEHEKGFSNPAVRMDQQIYSLQGKWSGPQLIVGSIFQYRNFQAGGFYWTPDTREISLAAFGMIEGELIGLTYQVSSRFEFLNVIPKNESLSLSNIDPLKVTKRQFLLFSNAFALFKNWNKWEMSVGLMQTGRAPGIEDLYSDGPHLGSYAYEIGFPDLTLEKTIGIESAINYHHSKLDLKITGFSNYSPNYHISTKMGDGYVPGADWIEWGSGPSGWLYKYQMKGLKAKIYGIESDITYKPNNLITINCSFSALQGDNLTNEKPLAYMPPHKLFLSTALGKNNMSATVKLTKVFPQNRLSEFETETDGYFRVDLHSSFSFYSSNKTHKIFLQIDNVFNELYFNHLSRLKLIMPEMGRNISIQYRVNF